MQIHRMSALFGKLQGQTLELKSGFNIIEAPNESGKSTWCAFLASMFYGINSRERDRVGYIADKNRYAPWSGSAMSGRLDCRVGEDEITLLRTTKRAASPLHEFQALYAGTADPVPGLTGSTCGETLLGVSREVYERSAFIRQNGLPVTQDAGLERRIVALISSGEEDTSYSEASAALRQQLNRRRYNKSGQLPSLEAALQEVNTQIEELHSLEQQLTALHQQEEALTARQAELSRELAQHDLWDAQQQLQLLQQAEAAAQTAQQQMQLLQQRAQAAALPENETIARLRGAIVNLETVRKSLEQARDQRDEAMKALLKAEAAVSESPFTGQNAEQARRDAECPPEPPVSRWSEMAVFFLSLAASSAVTMAVALRCAPLGGIWRFVPWALFAFLALMSISIARTVYRHKVRKAQTTLLLKRFGTADPAEISALADTYIKCIETRDVAQAEVDRRTGTADALYDSLTSNEQGILLEVRRFAPAAHDIPAADAALRQCAVQRKQLTEAETSARETKLRFELLLQQTPNAQTGTSATAIPPLHSRSVVTSELEQVRARIAAAHSAADQLIGRLQAIGDGALLSAQAQQLENQIAQLEAEYSALRLAMDTLDSANSTLQNRFSPELGRRAAEIFGELTDGKYSGVVLDRTFHLSAEPTDDSVYRDAQLLSAGALDQLYLAVRLAVCELVLPKDRAVPLVLDDALTNFDDQRCAAALKWLKRASKDRQILLFTCHSREAKFFAGDDEVHVQRLTVSAPQV